MFNIIVKDGKFILEADIFKLAETGKATPGSHFMNLATIRGFFLQASEECLFHYQNEVKKTDTIIKPGNGQKIPLNLVH